MYRDLYSAIMCRPLLSARGRAKMRKKGSPWSASAADQGRIEKRRRAGQPLFFISRAGAQNYQAFTLYIMRFAKRVPASYPSLSIPAAGRGRPARWRPLQGGDRRAGQIARAPDDRRRSRRAGFLEKALTLLIASGITRSRNQGDSRVDSDSSTSGASRRKAQIVCTSWRSSISEAGFNTAGAGTQAREGDRIAAAPVALLQPQQVLSDYKAVHSPAVGKADERAKADLIDPRRA